MDFFFHLWHLHHLITTFTAHHLNVRMWITISASGNKPAQESPAVWFTNCKLSESPAPLGGRTKIGTCNAHVNDASRQTGCSYFWTRKLACSQTVSCNCLQGNFNSHVPKLVYWHWTQQSGRIWKKKAVAMKPTQIQLNPRSFHHQYNWPTSFFFVLGSTFTSISPRQDPPKAGSKGQPGNLFEAENLERLMGRMCYLLRF